MGGGREGGGSGSAEVKNGDENIYEKSRNLMRKCEKYQCYDQKEKLVRINEIVCEFLFQIKSGDVF